MGGIECLVQVVLPEVWQNSLKIQKKSSRRLAISQMWCIVCVLPKGSELLPLPKIGDKTIHQP